MFRYRQQLYEQQTKNLCKAHTRTHMSYICELTHLHIHIVKSAAKWLAVWPIDIILIGARTKQNTPKTHIVAKLLSFQIQNAIAEKIESRIENEGEGKGATRKCVNEMFIFI